MLPSPSLGPPLLSGSWSPPLCCGMGFAVCAGAAGCVVAGGGLGPEECPAAAVPQPAARAVSSATPAAHRPRVNDMACPSDSQVISGEPAKTPLELLAPARQAAPRLEGFRRGLWGVRRGRADDGRSRGGSQ